MPILSETLENIWIYDDEKYPKGVWNVHCIVEINSFRLCAQLEAA